MQYLDCEDIRTATPMKWTSAVVDRRALVGLALLSFAVPSLGSDPPDVKTIVERWTAANRADFDAAPHYNYVERVRDDDGTKTYDVTMLFGSPYKRLLKQDGMPLDEEEQRRQSDEFGRTRRERAGESPGERAQRIADYDKKREQAHRIIEEMPRAFDYSLDSTRRMNSRDTYLLTATPRRDYDPPTTEAEVLTGMRGQFWIDATTFQLVHGRARVLHPVSIEGFLATVQPGTEFEVEQQPVGESVWLPTHVAIHTRSSIVFLFHRHSAEDRTYFNYRKSQSP
jgi:hypothetical protein